MKTKKTLFYTLTGYIVVNVATVVNAQNCPQLKPDTNQIKVTSDAATLRKEADIKSIKGPSIQTGDKLNPLLIESKDSVVSKNQECWYKVESPKDNQPYWIEKQGIIQDVFQSIQATSSPIPAIKQQIPNTISETRDSNAKISANKNRTLADYLSILLPINLLVTIFSTAFLWWLTNEKFNKLKQDIIKNRSGLKSIQDKIIEETSRLKNHSDQNTQQIVNKTTSGINQLSSLIAENTQISRTDNRSSSYGSIAQNPQQNDLQDWSYPDNTQNVELSNPSQFSGARQINSHEPNSSNANSSLLLGIIECFNKNNVEYFNNDGFILLAPVSTGSLGNDGKTKINFQKAEGNFSQAPYLGLTTDGNKTYLIPNLHNGRWKQLVLNNEDKIFEFTDQSLILSEPAELVSIGDGVWRLESPVKFQ
jgi:hypothetical protein